MADDDTPFYRDARESLLTSAADRCTISDVSRAYAKYFKEALEVSADEINEELTSHSNRKGSSQRMAETPGLGLAGIHRTGFSSVSIHTVFDYHFGSITMSHHAGKALSGWTARFGEFTPGGQMPTFDDITTELEPLERFTDVLFADDTAKRWRPKVRELLVMSLFLRYDQFVDVLTANPFQKPLLVEDETWDGLHDTPASVRNNLFLCRIHQALEKADAQDWFPLWKEQTRQSFVNRNKYGIEIQTYHLYNVDIDSNRTMDPRTFTDHYNLLAATTQSNHMELQQQRHMLSDLFRLQKETLLLTKSVASKQVDMEKRLQRLERHLIGEEEPPSPPP